MDSIIKNEEYTVADFGFDRMIPKKELGSRSGHVGTREGEIWIRETQDHASCSVSEDS